MKVSEIFYSVQGEGARVGTPTIFIRLSGCKTKHACYKLGIKCDTEFESGKEMSKEDIHKYIKNLTYNCFEITWTGGEPADQLTEDIIAYFKNCGYYQTIETSGLKPIPKNLDFVCVSPKVAEHVIKKNFDYQIDELRYVRHEGQDIPQPSIKAKHYFISPHSDGFDINVNNLNHCIKLIKDNPEWKISVQMHKIWSVL
jgi:organic radical activating enzyme